NDVLAEVIIQRMTNEELLSQILMFGWSGAEPTPLLNAWVQDRALGSVKVFGWNTDDINLVAKSITELQKKAQTCRFKIPLYVATDQEGGSVRHVKGDTSDTPGNLAIGSSGYPQDAYYTGYYIGLELRALGINMNFAPTIDIYSTIKSTVIGPRSFGENPEYTGILGAAWAKGHADAGIIATAKHFPGHGDTDVDSHGALPIIEIDEETLFSRELIPFMSLIESGVPAIMTGHISFPKIVPNGEPASLSKTFVTGVLRDKLGYEGLVITDDIMMNGAWKFAGVVSNVVKLAIEAGNDIVISSSTAGLNDALWRNNLQLMSTDENFYYQVRKAAHRVVKSKLDYFKGENPVPLYPDASKVDSSIPAPGSEEFFFQQACRSISALKTGTFPYTSEIAANEKVLLCGQFFAYGDELIKRYPHAEIYSYKYNMDNENLSKYLSELPYYARRFDTVIFCVSDPGSARLAKSLKDAGCRVIIISILSPNYVIDLDFADTILLAYSYSDFSFQAVAAALAGEIDILGNLPLTIPSKEE
ncbi:MAG: glycoside hydrolase family 3 protein, partial [Treponemataceae bacterium]|nr:glycoside hydrolase family 3 protein [Treponemataceae bacterium]